MALGLGSALRRAGSMLPAPLLRGLAMPAALFFHGVERRIADSGMQSIHHEFSAFCDIADQLARDFDVLPLSMLGETLAQPQRHRRSVFLMADDGYLNNLTEADAILRARNLPWTLFVSTRHIDTGKRNPLFLARLFLLCVPSGNYDVENLGKIDASTRPGAAEIESRLAALKRLDAVRAQAAIESMRAQFPALDEYAARFASESFLDWNQIAELKAHGVEIGAHADSHWAMHDSQSRDYLREQATRSRSAIEARIGPCRYFAYPFGNVGDVGREAWRAVRDAGFDYAFTTLSGSLDASRNRWLLPRYGLRPREPNLAALAPVLRLGNPRLRGFQRSLA